MRPENLVSLLEADRALSASAFAAKHKKHLLRVFPILLVHAEDLGAFTRGECVAEVAVCDDSSHSSLTLEAVGAVRRTLLLTHTRRASVTANMLLASGAKRAAFVGESDVLSHILTRKTSGFGRHGQGRYAFCRRSCQSGRSGIMRGEGT